MKKIKAYRCEVDLYRNNGFVFRTPKTRLYQRNTKGVYIVGAKSKEEAKKLLQHKIKFGSINIPDHQYVPEQHKQIDYKEIRKII